MKTLSLRQPWAWLVVHGGKHIENRTWNTSYRGPVLVHAAQGMTDEEYSDAVAFARGVDVLLARVVPPPNMLERGGIVGRARIVGVISPCESTLFSKGCPHPWHMPGCYGFMLTDVSAVPFTALRGMPGLFDYYGYIEHRADGWPLCPQCEHDELYSLADPPTIETIEGCYACNWKPRRIG